jgi:hypothetical protein
MLLRMVLNNLMNFILQTIAIVPMIYFHLQLFKEKGHAHQSTALESVAD